MANNSKNKKFNKILHLEREKVKRTCKNLRSNKNFSCSVKRLSITIIAKSMNNKFNKILHLQKEKIKKGFEKSANFAKVTMIFLAMRED